MTARERSLSWAVNDTTSERPRPSRARANASAAWAASVANPCLHAFRRSRHPTSVAGVKGASKVAAREPGEAEKASRRALFECPQAPSVLLEVGDDAIDERVALQPGQRRREVPHDLGVGVQLSERRAVGRLPLAHE